MDKTFSMEINACMVSFGYKQRSNFSFHSILKNAERDLALCEKVHRKRTPASELLEILGGCFLRCAVGFCIISRDVRESVLGKNVSFKSL